MRSSRSSPSRRRGRRRLPLCGGQRRSSEGEAADGRRGLVVEIGMAEAGSLTGQRGATVAALTVYWDRPFFLFACAICWHRCFLLHRCHEFQKNAHGIRMFLLHGIRKFDQFRFDTAHKTISEQCICCIFCCSSLCVCQKMRWIFKAVVAQRYSVPRPCVGTVANISDGRDSHKAMPCT